MNVQQPVTGEYCVSAVSSHNHGHESHGQVVSSFDLGSALVEDYKALGADTDRRYERAVICQLIHENGGN
jgi:hypothetical protein